LTQFSYKKSRISLTSALTDNIIMIRKIFSSILCGCIILAYFVGVRSSGAATSKYALPVSEIAALPWQTFRRGQSDGDTGEIRAIQYLLRGRGFYKGRINGTFDRRTAASVRAFQRKNKLRIDGVVAAQTFSRLIRPVKRGDRGDVVRALQVLLPSEMGHYHRKGKPALPYLKVDGIFGAKTESGVRQVQRDSHNSFHEEPVNGIVGPKMWWLLFDGQSVGVS
jgi:peptidoglycan hydrolase-like protein with peptidoglycan-binding domain